MLYDDDENGVAESTQMLRLEDFEVEIEIDEPAAPQRNTRQSVYPAGWSPPRDFVLMTCLARVTSGPDECIVFARSKNELDRVLRERRRLKRLDAMFDVQFFPLKQIEEGESA